MNLVVVSAIVLAMMVMTCPPEVGGREPVPNEIEDPINFDLDPCVLKACQTLCKIALGYNHVRDARCYADNRVCTCFRKFS
ncbi:hypothetical protein ACP275_01G066500 [Erythranthe tilingii]